MGIFQNDEERDSFVNYILSEVKLAESERASKLRDFRRYRRQRMAIPDKKWRNWPWPKASNICTPLALINTNGTFGSLKATFGVTSPRVQLKSQVTKLESPVKAFNKLLNIYVTSTKRVNINEVDNTILYDCGSLGTQFARVAWDRDVFNLKRRNAEGEIVQKEIVRKNSPVVVPYRIEDVLTRIHFTNVHTAPWIATISNLHEHELRQREAKGIFSNVDKIFETSGSEQNIPKQEENSDMGFSPVEDDTFAILEVNAFWDVDGDGVFEDVKVWIEKKSGTVLREEFNELGKRDIVRIPYVHVPYSIYALGVGAIVDHMQQESDALHNLRIDQQIMSLAPMFKVKNDSVKAGDDDIEPGKIWRMEDIRDMEEFRTHDLSSNAIQSEFLVNQYAGQATSINNSMLGQPDMVSKSGGTSSGYMFQAQQSVRQFTSSVVENIKTGYSEIFQLVVLQMILHKDELDYGLIDENERPLVEEILRINPEDFTTTFNCEVNITEQTETEEAKKQARIMLIQFYSQFGERLIQLSGMLENPQIGQKTKEFAARLIVGAVKILDDILDDFDHKDESQLLPYIGDLAFMLQQMDFVKQQQLGAAIQNSMQQQGMQGGMMGGGSPQGGSSAMTPPAPNMMEGGMNA